MSSDLKRLVDELEILLAERGVLLDAPARDEFEAWLGRLKGVADEADAAAADRLRVDALDLFAALLSVLTNVMTLFK